MDRTMPSDSQPIIFVLGSPGSGKGTLCKLATQRLGSSHHRYCHLSVGDYLRELSHPEMPSEEKGVEHQIIHDYLQDNKLLPADVLIPILKRKINSTPNEKGTLTTWLIDGFPRNMETALAFEEKVIGKPVKVITLECERAIAERRFLRRGREKIDDEKRFDKRHNEYVETMKAIREHYARIMVSAPVDGNLVESLIEFMEVLPPTGNNWGTRNREGRSGDVYSAENER
ncbi:P-loop containing nucleoside triphosphate hydrolase protein [Nemania abortiva]|nr:P-loop containing nucleoside triphosphate hydrolase protein [Nemania abortiva]